MEMILTSQQVRELVSKVSQKNPASALARLDASPVRHSVSPSFRAAELLAEYSRRKSEDAEVGFESPKGLDDFLSTLEREMTRGNNVRLLTHLSGNERLVVLLSSDGDRALDWYIAPVVNRELERVSGETRVWFPAEDASEDLTLRNSDATFLRFGTMWEATVLTPDAIQDVLKSNRTRDEKFDAFRCWNLIVAAKPGIQALTDAVAGAVSDGSEMAFWDVGEGVLLGNDGLASDKEIIDDQFSVDMAVNVSPRIDVVVSAAAGGKRTALVNVNDRTVRVNFVTFQHVQDRLDESGFFRDADAIFVRTLDDAPLRSTIAVEFRKPELLGFRYADSHQRVTLEQADAFLAEVPKVPAALGNSGLAF